MQTRFTVELSEEAAALLLESTTERNKGKWLSALILNCAHGSELGVTERIDQRLVRVERKIDQMIERGVEVVTVADVGPADVVPKRKGKGGG